MDQITGLIKRVARSDPKPIFEFVGIDHGGPHIATPQKFLDSADVVVGVRPKMALFQLSRVKHEIRISKSETNPKFECSNALNKQNGEERFFRVV